MPGWHVCDRKHGDTVFLARLSDPLPQGMPPMCPLHPLPWLAAVATIQSEGCMGRGQQ